jgi:hypothetical protein
MRRTGALLAVTAFMAVPLFACARQPADAIPTVREADAGGAAPATTTDVIAAMVDWAQCMRDKGFDVPDPYLDPASGKVTFGFEGPGKGDPLEDQFVTAEQACEPYEKAYQDLEPRPPFSDAELALWLVFAECMRDNGVPMNDPDQASGRAPEPIGELRPGGAVERATQACHDEMLAGRAARSGS